MYGWSVGVFLWMAIMGSWAHANTPDYPEDNDAQYVAYQTNHPEAMQQMLQARIALSGAIKNLHKHGINAQDYRASLNGVEPEDKVGLMRVMGEIVADLRFGMTRSSDEFDAQKSEIARLMASLIYCTKLDACFDDIAARHEQYKPLQATLALYEQIALSGGWQAIDAGPLLKPHMHDARVPALRERLMLSGDYRSAKPVFTQRKDKYDDELIAAVKAFQQRQGLKADGVIGPATLRVLNVPVQKRITQLKLSLERLRRLPEMGDERYVHVNIPSYTLRAYAQGKQQLAMDVIVGKKSRQTPQFDNVITTVGLNPTWTPTYRILSRDLLPKFRRDPSYATRGGYQLRERHTGRSLSPSQIDWASVSANDIRVVQKPGRKNALGKVKFLLPNNQSVYLHDTAKPQLFSKPMRALSSGCVRLSEPKRFLDYVIAAQADSTFNKLHDYYASNQNKHVRLGKPLRVRTTYLTTWVDEQGQVAFYDDVYDKNSRLELAMSLNNKQFAAAY